LRGGRGRRAKRRNLVRTRGYGAAVGPAQKDVVTTVLGASAGVGGLVLVFLGILISAIGTFAGDTPDTVLKPYRLGAWASVGVFALSLVAVALSLIWLAVDQPHWLYVLALVAFSSLLAAVLALAAAVTKATV
jgi:hypothetical protein